MVKKSEYDKCKAEYYNVPQDDNNTFYRFLAAFTHFKLDSPYSFAGSGASQELYF
jgi:hypothetical protein